MVTVRVYRPNFLGQVGRKVICAIPDSRRCDYLLLVRKETMQSQTARLTTGVGYGGGRLEYTAYIPYRKIRIIIRIRIWPTL